MTTANIYPLGQPRGRKFRSLRKESASSSAMLGAPWQAPDDFTGKDASHPSREEAFKVRTRCPVRQNLLEEYNRMFNSWVAQEGERGGELDFSDFEILAQIEEAHQRLLRHQQSCSTCQQSR